MRVTFRQGLAAILTLLPPLWFSPALAAVSTSSPAPTDFRAQLSPFTDLITVEADGSFRALQNQTLSPILLGGAILLTDPQPNWIERTRTLRHGLAQQGWDLMTAEPSADPEQVRARAQALIDAQRTAGNKRIVVIALERQAASAIELVKEASDLRLVMYNASSGTAATEALNTQIEILRKTLTIELYTRSITPTEASRRHQIAQKTKLATYRARQLSGPPPTTAQLTPTETKRILGAIKTLIIEFEQQKS